MASVWLSTADAVHSALATRPRAATRRWQVDGTLTAMHARVLGLAEERGLIHWPDGAVDGSYSPLQGG